MKPVFLVKAFHLSDWQAEVNGSVRTVAVWRAHRSGAFLRANLPLLCTPCHRGSVFENILFLCSRLLFVRRRCFKRQPRLVCFFGSLHNMRKNNVVVFPWWRPWWQEKEKAVAFLLYVGYETLSGAELVNCIKHLMSVCGNTPKHFQPGCLRPLRNSWAQGWCVCRQQALI